MASTEHQIKSEGGAHHERAHPTQVCVLGIHQWYGRLSKVGHARRHHAVHRRRRHRQDAYSHVKVVGGGWWMVVGYGDAEGEGEGEGER